MDNTQRSQQLTRSLLRWYDSYKRDLPWRTTNDPYAIWISEIMAQQTRITALLPYYTRFVAQFPTVRELAAAPEDEVLKAWEGLGYYSRARNLHKAARLIVDEHDGRLPDTAEGLERLPGIGTYTAGAIMSIAYGVPTPAVDGNVLRVFARIDNDSTDITTPQAKSLATAFVQRLMPPDRAGAFTQALMELGALVCAPKSPQCEECPVRDLCLAYAAGRQLELPVKAPKKPQKEQPKTVLILENDSGQILMRRRTEPLLRGLWTLYMTDGQLNEREVSAHLRELGVSIDTAEPLGDAQHVFTHIIWRMTGYRCHIQGAPVLDDYVWIDKSDVHTLAAPVALKYYMDCLT